MKVSAAAASTMARSKIRVTSTLSFWPLKARASAGALAFNGQKLSTEVTRILERAIVDAAAAQNFNAALEIGYRAFGASACTAAAREGIDAFLSRRAADFTKTG